MNKPLDANDILRAEGVDGLRDAWDRAHEEAQERNAKRKANGDGGEQQEQQSDKSTLKGGIRLMCLENVEARSVEWIWPGRLARGKFGLLTGDPDMGKSQIATDITARISRGARWPDAGQAPLGSAIILSSEDGLADTIRPRLEAAGGDPARVFCLQSVVTGEGKERTFSIKDDIARLESCIAEMPDVVIIVVDPITAYMGDKIDSHQTTDVRGVLEPFIGFADRTNVAILGITHPTKASQAKAINSFTGSLAYLACSRLAFIAIREPETDRRLLLSVKNNLGPPAAGLGYSIKETIISKGLAAPHVAWDGEPVTVNANEAVRASSGTSDGKIKEAKEWLAEELATGPKPAKTVEREAKREGISERTLRRAKKEIGVITEKVGLDEGWWWRLAA